MFSGLTNQVSSWMGAVKGEPHDEEVPTPTAQANAAAAATATTVLTDDAAAATTSTTAALDDPALQHEIQLDGGEGQVLIGEDGKEHSPTKASGMFSNVKSQMSGWLGSASIPSMPSMPAMPGIPSMPSIPSIPGLRKGGPGEEAGIANDGMAPDAAAAAGGMHAEGIAGHSGDGGDDEDKSSATEGADSRPASGGGSPTDEQAGQIGNVTTKVTQGAKTFGSFLYSAVNKAGAKIKETVKDNEAFIRGQGQKSDVASTPPWMGHANEEKVKEEILGLSADRRNFVRAPPAGVDFEFNYDQSYPMALAIMAEDAALEKMRFELVPKIITEENFWRNYFYRVSLICQAGDLGTLGQEGSLSEDIEVKKVIADEFVSDTTFQTTEKDLEEVRTGLRKLGVDTFIDQVIQDEAILKEEQWEKDLEAELQDYEMLNDAGNNTRTATAPASDQDWEKDCDELLGDIDDLK